MKQSSVPDSTSTKKDDFELLTDYELYTRQFSEAPPHFHMFTLFATIACIVGRGRYIIQGEDTIYPNLYCLIVAPSSLYKKTSSISLLKKWLARLEMMADRYIGQIGSPEGLFAALKENGGDAVAFYSELGLLLGQTAGKKYMRETLELLNDLYDCPAYYSKRLSQQLLRAENVCFNLIAASQLDSLTKYVRESDLLSGFLPRFAVVFSDKLQPHIVRRPPPDLKLQNKILQRLNDIRKFCKQHAPMELSQDAWDYFESWAMTEHANALVAPPQLKPMYGRLETHALKFSTIIHLSRNPASKIIDETSTMAGCTCAELILKSYRKLVMEELTFTVNERKLKKVSDFIRNNGEIPHREVANHTRYPPRELREIIQNLHDMEKIKTKKGKRGGKIYQWVDGLEK
jgi:hypothetical protein